MISILIDKCCNSSKLYIIAWLIEDCRDAIDWKEVKSTINAIAIRMTFFIIVLFSFLSPSTKLFGFVGSVFKGSLEGETMSHSDPENPLLTLPDSFIFVVCTLSLSTLHCRKKSRNSLAEVKHLTPDTWC